MPEEHTLTCNDPKKHYGARSSKRLAKLGYSVVRQKGSHIRIKTVENGPHLETIPNHKPLKEGTANKILKNISDHFGMTKQELETLLFGQKS